MADQDIGVGRVHLIVDAADYDAAIARATNSAVGFGNTAEAAFDKSSGSVRRAAKQLLDYVANLGKTSEQMRLLKAAQQGVDGSIIDAAAAAMVKYRNETEAAAAAARELNRAHDEASRVNAAFDIQRGENSQRAFNSLLGVGDTDAAMQARRRQDAESALLPVLQAQEREYQQMVTLAHQINDARDEQLRMNAQAAFNSDYGVQGERSGAYLAEQQRAVAALTAQFNQMDATIDEAFAHNRNIVQFEKYLENIRVTAGKTHYELLQLKADQLGIGQAARPMIKAIQDQDKAMGHAGLTAKQYEWAMRGLPAQMTDITVGLLTGQTPWMVVLQQGGQLKDMFGGIVPAAKAVGGAIWGLVNPYTLAAAAVAGLALAGYDAAKSMEELAISTAKGGGIAGSATQLYDLVNSLNALDGIRLGGAEEAVNRLAAGGKLAGENFRMAAEATARWASVSGEAADDVAGKFESIAKGPLEAIESGLVRVTVEQRNHIKALVDAGDQQGAVNELTRIFYETVNNNSAQVEAHLSGITRYWRLVADNVGEATRGVGDFVNTIADYAVRYEKTYQRMVSQGTWGIFAQVGAFNTDEDFSDVTGRDMGAAAQNYNPEEAKRERDRTERLAQWSATADKAAGRLKRTSKPSCSASVMNGKRLTPKLLRAAHKVVTVHKLFATRQLQRLLRSRRRPSKSSRSTNSAKLALKTTTRNCTPLPTKNWR